MTDKKDELNLAWEGFLKMRKEIKKPVTDRALKMLEKKLQVLSNGKEEIAIQILDQSNIYCYLDFYPLKDNTQQNQHGTPSNDKSYERIT